MWDLIIFDCDGVLVDSEPVANEILAKHLSALGIPHTVDDCYRRYRGLSMPAVVDRIQSLFSIALPPQFVTRLQQETFAAFEQQLQPVAGVESVLDYLCSRNLPYCVASSGSHDKLSFTLTATGLISYFRTRIFSAEDVSSGKPAPDLFLYAADTMNAVPNRCVVIEDSLPGVQAALSAQMHAVAFCPPNSGFGSSLKQTADQLNCRTIRHMSEFIGLVENSAV